MWLNPQISGQEYERLRAIHYAQVGLHKATRSHYTEHSLTLLLTHLYNILSPLLSTVPLSDIN